MILHILIGFFIYILISALVAGIANRTHRRDDRIAILADIIVGFIWPILPFMFLFACIFRAGNGTLFRKVK